MATTSFGSSTVSIASTQILLPNNGRRVFVIHNNGSNIIYVGLDSTVLSTSGIGILPQDKWVMNGAQMWQGSVWGITSSGSSDVRYWDIGG